MKNTLKEFEKEYNYSVNIENNTFEYKVARIMPEWNRVLSFAKDNLLNDKYLARYRGREGIHIEDNDKLPQDQKASLTSLVGIHKESRRTILAGTIFYFPMELKKSIPLFINKGNYLEKTDYYQINNSNKGLIYLRFIRTNQKYKFLCKYENAKAYLKFLNTFIDFYNPDADIAGGVQGNFSLKEYINFNGKVNVSELSEDIKNKMGFPREESLGTKNFFDKIGLKKLENIIFIPDLGPFYDGNLSNINLEFNRKY